MRLSPRQGTNSREKAEQNFTLEIQANNYLSLYKNIYRTPM